jgi:hypothetical protein
MEAAAVWLPAATAAAPLLMFAVGGQQQPTQTGVF